MERYYEVKLLIRDQLDLENFPKDEFLEPQEVLEVFSTSKDIQAGLEVLRGSIKEMSRAEVSRLEEEEG